MAASNNLPQGPFYHLILLLFTLLLLTITPTQAADLNIFDSSSTYHYAGCWNETTEIPNTEGLRALAGGSSEQVPVTMTVPLCLNYCAGNNTAKTQYRVAGLEYSRECWCADELSSLSVKLDDADCNTACDGDNTTACGGALRLSLYNLTEDGKNDASRGGRGLDMGMLATGVLVGSVAAVVGLL